MKKTTTPIYLPLSKQAMKWLPERGDASGNELVFGDLPNRGRIGVHLGKWAKDAGITKSMSYHTSRHTFATMMLTLGVDLYTVSKLLGHTKVETTQIYAKIINKKKDDAVSLIDDAFSDMEF
jgi:integrase